MKRGFLIGAAVWATVSAWALGAELDRSPFLPPDAPAQNEDLTGPDGIELHGIMSTSSGSAYNIYYGQKKTSVWIGLNKSVDGVTVVSADPVRETVVVNVNGQVVALALKSSKIAQGFGMAPGTFAIVPLGAPAPQDEQARLKAVMDAVRARREARARAARQAQQDGR